MNLLHEFYHRSIDACPLTAEAREREELAFEEWMKQRTFDEATRPLIQWMNQQPHHHPHKKIIIHNTGAEMMEGITSTGDVFDYLQD